MEATWLEEVLEDFEDDLTPEGALSPDGIDERYTPTTDSEFEWAIRKRARANAKAADIKAHRDYELKLLAEKFERLIEAEERTAAFFDEMIERGIMAMEPDASGKRKVKTVAGTAYTSTKEHFEWPDDEALVGWAKEHLPDAVRVKESPDKTAIKAHVKETGEAPDGLTVEKRVSVVVREA